MWMASRVSNVRTVSLAYHELLSAFCMTTLKARRTQYDLIFLRNVYRGDVDAPFLLSSYPLHVPVRITRRPSLFQQSYARVNTVKAGMFNRIPEEMNAFLHKVPAADVFAMSLCSFKVHVKRYIMEVP